MNSIIIADLGTGNLRSVLNAMNQVAQDDQVSISSDPESIMNSDYLVLPGQGAIGTWINQLNENKSLKDAVLSRLKTGPVLGICLGLQALCSHSEENGGVNGFGVIPSKVKKFAHNISKEMGDAVSNKLKVPHMGWNQVAQTESHPLWQGIPNNERFYFVHSYYVESGEDSRECGRCEYGIPFTAASTEKNWFATQFHPEKSHRAGLQLLKNFVNWNGSN